MSFSFFDDHVITTWVIIIAILISMILCINILLTYFSKGYLAKAKYQTKHRMAKHLSKKIKRRGEPKDAVQWIRVRWENNHHGLYIIRNLLNEKDYLDIVKMARKTME